MVKVVVVEEEEEEEEEEKKEEERFTPKRGLEQKKSRRTFSK
jgi:hypothetical protein